VAVVDLLEEIAAQDDDRSDVPVQHVQAALATLGRSARGVSATEEQAHEYDTL
jgi:hypothetical protein